MNQRDAISETWKKLGLESKPEQVVESLKASGIDVTAAYVSEVKEQIRHPWDASMRRQRKIVSTALLLIVVVLLYLGGVAISYYMLGRWAFPMAMRIGFWLGILAVLVGVGLLRATSGRSKVARTTARFASLSAVLATAPLVLATALLYLPPFEDPHSLASSPMLAGIGATLQKNFEQRMADSQEAFRQEDLLEAMQRSVLQGIKIDDFESSMKIDVQAKQQPAGDLLAELLTPLGWSVQEAGATRAALNRRISTDLQQVSRWEAIETVCRLIDVTPKYPTPIDVPLGGILSSGFATVERAMEAQTGTKPKIPRSAVIGAGSHVTFEPHARSLPVAFAGPYLIELNEVTEDPGNATGRVQVSSWAHGLSPSLMAIDQPMSPIECDQIRGSDSSDLNANVFLGGMGNFPWHQSLWALRGLLQEVRIFTLRGTATVLVPTEVLSLRFDELKKGDKETTADGSIEIIQFETGMFDRYGRGKQQGAHVHVRLENLGIGEPIFVANDSDGNSLLIDVTSGDEMGGGASWGLAHRSGRRRVTTSLTIWGEPKTLVVKLPTTIERLTYPFELSDIPLHLASQQPVELPPLEFGDRPAPITVEVLEIVRDSAISKVTARVTNHANRDIEQMELELQYVDSSGKTLKSQTDRESGFGNPAKPLVAAESEATLELTAFFMPDETTQVVPKLKMLRFSNYTEWRPDEE